MKKLILFLVLILLGSFTCFADLTSNLENVYSFDNAANPTIGKLFDEVGNMNFTGTVASQNVTGISKEAYEFSVQYLEKLGTFGISGNVDFTISLWFKSTDGTQFMNFYYFSTGGGNALSNTNIAGDGQVNVDYQGAGGVISDADYTDGAWHNLVTTVDVSGNVLRSYIDGVNKINATKPAGWNLQDTFFNLGRQIGSPARDYTGTMDEVYLWSRTLSALEVAELGTSFYPFSGTVVFEPPTPDDGEANNTQVTINVSCDTGNVTLWFDDNVIPSTIVIDDAESPASYLTSVSTDGEYYYSASCDAGVVNSSRSWVYDTTPPSFTILKDLESPDLTVDLEDFINVSDGLSGLKECFSNFTYSNGTQLNSNCNDTVIFPFAGIWEMSSYFVDYAQNSNTSLNNFTIDPINEVYFIDNSTLEPLSNTSVLITFPSLATLTLVTDINGRVNFSSILNNDVEVGTYDYTIGDKLGFVTPVTFSQTVELTDIPFNVTYDIKRANIYINIYDRETDLLIDFQESIVQIIGLDSFNTSNGTITLSNASIVSGTYTALASSLGYVTEKQTFTFTNQNEINLNFYLVNESSPNIGNLIIQVLDDFFNLQAGADTRLLELKGGSFVEIAQCDTNTNGECIYSVELNSKFYLSTASKLIKGVLFEGISSGSGEVIKIDNTLIEIHLTTGEKFEIGELYDLRIVPSNISLVGNTSFLTANFIDLSGLDHTVCIEYFFLDHSIKKSLSAPSCVTASSGIVNFGGGFLLDRDYTNIAEIYVVNSEGVKIPYDEYPYPALEGSFFSNFGLYVKPIILFLYLILLAFAVQLKKISIFGIGSIPLSFATLFFAPTVIGGVTISFIVVMGLFIIYLSKRKNEAF